MIAIVVIAEVPFSNKASDRSAYPFITTTFMSATQTALRKLTVDLQLLSTASDQKRRLEEAKELVTTAKWEDLRECGSAEILMELSTAYVPDDEDKAGVSFDHRSNIRSS